VITDPTCPGGLGEKRKMPDREMSRAASSSSFFPASTRTWSGTAMRAWARRSSGLVEVGKDFQSRRPGYTVQ
jgi:hypothetical protein